MCKKTIFVIGLTCCLLTFGITFGNDIIHEDQNGWRMNDVPTNQDTSRHFNERESEPYRLGKLRRWGYLAGKAFDTQRRQVFGDCRRESRTA